MSIATDVSRIKGNITAALAAIADKGVTVPDGSTSDALASLIESIEAGRGGAEVNIGSFILSSEIKIYGTDGYSIIHGLSSSPDLFVVLIKDDDIYYAGVLSLYIYYKNKSSLNAVYGGVGSNGYTKIKHIAPTITNETVTIISDDEKITNLINKKEYIWIAMGGLP